MYTLTVHMHSKFSYTRHENDFCHLTYSHAISNMEGNIFLNFFSIMVLHGLPNSMQWPI